MRSLRMVIFFIFLLMLSIVVETGLSVDSDTPWKAQWIGLDEPSSPNQWTCFRKVFELAGKPEAVTVRIAVDSKYWLWINGEMVVFEGQLKRGPTPLDSYYDQIDISRYLQKGKNSIAFLVWYFGKEGFSHKNSGKAAMVFESVGDTVRLLSDRTWKVLKNPAYGNTGEPRPNWRLAESNIAFDAGKEPVGWYKAGFDDSKWQAAVEFGPPPAAPWNKLIQRPIPMWKNSGLVDYVSTSVRREGDLQVVTAKLPYNTHITPWFKVKAPAGKLIDVRMDNYKGGSEFNVRAEYITKDGIQEYESFGWMNGHEVHYSFPADVEVVALKYRETGFNTEFTGKFECDDEFLMRLRMKALRTLYVTMRDNYFDCPDRERAQWWGDMVNEMGEAFYAMDMQSSLLAKKGILELIKWQRADNTIYSPIPAGNWDKELPMQMLNSVGFYGFWTYLLYSGDVETIKTVYPGVKKYINIWETGEDGLVKHRKGGWTWGDWGEDKDMTILYNGWYYLALKGLNEMAKATGNTDDQDAIKGKMKVIESNFNKTFWNGKEYRSPDYKGKTDDRAHALAVVSGLAGPDKYEAIRQVFKTERHASPYMEKYIMEALYIMRFPDDAIERTKVRFKPMVDHEYSTLWEGWGIGGSGFGGGTINHAWSGGALTVMSQYMAGIAPDSIAYKTYHVMPQMGPLKAVSAAVQSPRGEIRVDLKRLEDSFILQLVSPKDTTATVGIPVNVLDRISAVKVNGKTIWQDGKAGRKISDVEFFGSDEHYIKFNVQPGSYEFTASR